MGLLKGFDHVTNIILSDTEERIYSPDEGVERAALGMLMLRGDFVAAIGEVNEDIEKTVDWDTVRGHQLYPTKRR